MRYEADTAKSDYLKSCVPKKSIIVDKVLSKIIRKLPTEKLVVGNWKLE